MPQHCGAGELNAGRSAILDNCLETQAHPSPATARKNQARWQGRRRDSPFKAPGCDTWPRCLKGRGCRPHKAASSVLPRKTTHLWGASVATLGYTPGSTVAFARQRDPLSAPWQPLNVPFPMAAPGSLLTVQPSPACRHGIRFDTFGDDHGFVLPMQVKDTMIREGQRVSGPYLTRHMNPAPHPIWLAKDGLCFKDNVAALVSPNLG